jgi:Zn ribbon nucleic-acid-binding protein
VTVLEEPDEDRAPICPACGVTNLLVADGEDVASACVECGFDERSAD